MSNSECLDILTGDLKQIKVPKRIIHSSKVFQSLIQNYKFDKQEKIEKMNYNDLELLINFCETIEYQQISFEKPLWKYSLNYHLKTISNNSQQFYKEHINIENLSKYIFISDFYEVSSLEEIIYLKLFELFGTENSIKNNLLIEDSNNEIDKQMKIDEERKQFLREKYRYYVNKQLELLTDNEIIDLVSKFYE